MSGINQQNAFVFRITHIDNVPWMLTHGVHCRSSSARDPNFRTIGDPELISRRATRLVPVPLPECSDVGIVVLESTAECGRLAWAGNRGG